MAERLRAAGHRGEAPDLPGCDLLANRIAEATRAGEWVILVGHSRGGIAIWQAAERASQAVVALVYVAVLILPDDGVAVMDLAQLVEEKGFVLPPSGMTALDAAENGSAVRRRSLRCTSPSRPRVRLGAAADERGTGALLLPRPPLTAERYGRAPRVYVAAERDGLLPYPARRAMVARAAPTERHVVDGKHQVILIHADGLAVLLTDVAERCG